MIKFGARFMNFIHLGLVSLHKIGLLNWAVSCRYDPPNMARKQPNAGATKPQVANDHVLESSVANRTRGHNCLSLKMCNLV